MSRNGGSLKGELRGAYVGGGIFAILLSIPLIFLFVPYFVHSVMGVFPWDPSQLGINQEMIDYVLNMVCYLLPALFFIINIIFLFIARSKSSVFIKLGTLLFLAYFVIKYTLLTVSNITGFNLYDMLANNSIIEYILVGGGLAFTLIGIILTFVDKGHPNRASAFLVFCGLFWMLAAAGQALIPMFMEGAENFLAYYEPFVLAVFGLLGGLMMLFCCRKRIDVSMPENVRKPKQDVQAVDGQNGMADGGIAMQPQMAAQNGMMANTMQTNEMAAPGQMQGQQPMQGQPQMQGQPSMPMGQPQMQPQMPQQMPNAMPQQNVAPQMQMPNQPQMPGQPPMQGPHVPPMGPRPPIQGQPHMQGAPMGPRPPMPGQQVPPMGPRPPMPGQQVPPMGPRPPIQGQQPMQGPQGAPMGPRPPVQGPQGAPVNPNGVPNGNDNPNGGTK